MALQGKVDLMIRMNRRTMGIEEAVKKAVDDCISQGVLREFLLKNKARVIKMSIYEYDEKKQRRLDHEDGVEEGIEKGKELGEIILVQKKIIRGKTLDAIAEDLESSIEEIKPIYETVTKNPLDTDPEEILRKLS